MNDARLILVQASFQRSRKIRYASTTKLKFINRYQVMLLRATLFMEQPVFAHLCELRINFSLCVVEIYFLIISFFWFLSFFGFFFFFTTLHYVLSQNVSLQEVFKNSVCACHLLHNSTHLVSCSHTLGKSLGDYL